MPGRHGKGKGPNPKKLAAAEIRFSAAVSGARSGAFSVGLIIGCLGNKSFRVRLSASEERTVAICGKVFQGGEHSASYARRGDWLIVSGTEVQGVLNGHRSSEFAELRAAGLVPDVALETAEPQTRARTAAEGDAPEGFSYEDDSGAAQAAAATWTDPTQTARSKRQAEEAASRAQQAAELAARIRARRAGLLARSAALPVVGAREDDTGFDLFSAAEVEEVPEETTEAGGAATGAAGPVDPLEAHEARKSRAVTSQRRLRKLALLAAAEEHYDYSAPAVARRFGLAEPFLHALTRLFLPRIQAEEARRAALLAELAAREQEAELARIQAEREAAEWEARHAAEMAAFAARAAEADWEELAGEELDAAIAAI
jgi:hypothetical protein